MFVCEFVSVFVTNKLCARMVYPTRDTYSESALSQKSLLVTLT